MHVNNRNSLYVETIQNFRDYINFRNHCFLIYFLLFTLRVKWDPSIQKGWKQLYLLICVIVQCENLLIVIMLFRVVLIVFLTIRTIKVLVRYYHDICSFEFNSRIPMLNWQGRGRRSGLKSMTVVISVTTKKSGNISQYDLEQKYVF